MTHWRSFAPELLGFVWTKVYVWKGLLMANDCHPVALTRSWWNALRNWFSSTSKTTSLPVWTLTNMLLKPTKLKGYSGVSLIHGLTHLDTEYDPPLRDKVCGPLAYVVLASKPWPSSWKGLHIEKERSAHDPKHTSSSVKQGGCIFMAWAFMASSGMDSLIFINQNKLRCLLKHCVMQQDNQGVCPIKKWMVLDWPSQSLELNPIEHAF